MSSPATSNQSEATPRLLLYARAFAGLLFRDIRVLQRDFFPFLTRTVMNPFLFVFVFTYVFPKIGQGMRSPGGVSFGTILVPGLVAVAIIFQGISAVALPLAVELGGTHEIEDRLMAPVPIYLVAVEKVTFSALQSMLAAAIVFPLVYVIPTTPVVIHVSSWILLIVVIILASFTGGAMGLVIGTAVTPQQIGLIFSVIVVPVTFLGCVYYPWGLLKAVPWLKYAVLANPLVYISEGLRASLTPDLPHMPPWIFLGALAVICGFLMSIGMKTFMRRVVS